MWRYVINHDAVASSLARDGWDILDPASLSFADQVGLFSQARVIAGLHGAGLTNMLFAPQAAIVELVGQYGDGLYRNMAHCLDHRYCLLPATQAGENVNVDVDALRRAGDDAMTPPGTGEIAHNLDNHRVAFR
jgi:capsular polysaccharide biosynthesis protein